MYEGQAELDLAMALFANVALSDGSGGGTAKVPVEEIRYLMQSAGEPLTDAEVRELLQLADPEGVGMVPLDRWTQLPCWELPSEPPPKPPQDPGKVTEVKVLSVSGVTEGMYRV